VGDRYDAGSKIGILKATVEFALRRPDLSEEFKTYLLERMRPFLEDSRFKQDK